MIALDSEGKLYTWGLDFMAEPICISDIPETTLSGKNIVKMKKGDLELLLLDDEGKVYEFENMHTPPICITDVEGTELYNKKIKDINVSIGSSSRVQAYITEDGELYAYIKQLPS